MGLPGYCGAVGAGPECQVPSAKKWHSGTRLYLALGTLALDSIWHLALWHSSSRAERHFGTPLLSPQYKLWRCECWGKPPSHAAS